MAFELGNDGVVTVGAVAIAEVTRFTFEETSDQKDGTAMGDTYKKSKAGRPTAQGTVEYRRDHTDTTGQDALAVGSEVALVLRPRGTGSGLPQRSLTAQIISLQEEVVDDEVLSGSFTYALSTGTVDKTDQV